MKGIILAARDSRSLWPATQPVPKVLLPLYDVPIIYHPLTSLMRAGIRDVLIIATPAERRSIQRALGAGRGFGVNLVYSDIAEPQGIAEALIVGEAFLENSPCALVAGDSVHIGRGMEEQLSQASSFQKGARVIAVRGEKRENYGAVALDSGGRPMQLGEELTSAGVSWALSDLYIYDAEAPSIAKNLRQSKREHFSITDLNRAYMDRGQLEVRTLGASDVWLDTRTHEAISEAGGYIRALQHRHGIQLACPEEIALHNDWLATEDLNIRVGSIVNTAYGAYLRGIIDKKLRARAGNI